MPNNARKLRSIATRLQKIADELNTIGYEKNAERIEAMVVLFTKAADDEEKEKP